MWWHVWCKFKNGTNGGLWNWHYTFQNDFRHNMTQGNSRHNNVMHCVWYSRITLDIISTQGNSGPDWENKTEKAFWRGRDSRQERLDLVMMSRKNPSLIDAAMTHMLFFPKNPEKYGELVKSVSFFDFFKVSCLLILERDFKINKHYLFYTSRDKKLTRQSFRVTNLHQ